MSNSSRNSTSVSILMSPAIFDDADMRLNWDILVSLPSYTEHSSDVLPIMLTCKTLYGAGMAAVLRRTVYIRSLQELSTFCDLVSQDTVRRAGYLRKIELDFNSSSVVPRDDLARRFASVMEHSRNLRRLVIVSAEGLLANKISAKALAFLTSVKELVVNHADEPQQSHFLSHFRSTLEKAQIFCDNGPTDPSDEAAQHVLSLLSRSQHTLRELHFWGPNPAISTFAVYPAVHRFEFTCWETIHTRSLAQIFPNARDMTISHRQPLKRRWPALASDLDVAGREYLRAENMLGAARWYKLDRLAGPVTVLYDAGVQTDVQVLDLTLDHAADPSLLRSVLNERNTKPTQVHLRLYTHWTAFKEGVRAFVDAASSALTHLDVTVVKQDVPQEAVILLCDVLAVASRLEDLTFTICGTSVGSSVDESVRSSFARQLAHAIPTLRKVNLGFSEVDNLWRWRVVRARSSEDVIDILPASETNGTMIGTVI